ncbi:restriction endonuclease subunit S [Halobacillus halophilus]|uniref:restriction endonuclease subunit S n=1 Tax=Halobacillus halophilus TaxID=1570 RepID=UPI001CD20470|nr:restriction endonuclease subunit S [Halobacillus halophilus]MCA1011767.1 restriction endonuclease subunit S [Halobacillus halophilus]
MSEISKKTPFGLIPSTWSFAPLRSIVCRITEKNENRSENVLTISARDGLVNQRDYFNKSVASKNLSKYVYLRKGDFAYNKSYSNGFPYGAIKRLEKYPVGIVSTLYICFRNSSESIDNEFLKYLFDSPLWHNEVRMIAKEGGRAHGLLNIGINEFFDIMLPIPPRKEQQKIAEILSSVDEAIEKTEQIIAQTEKVSKGLMQQLFTKGIGYSEFKKSSFGMIPKGWEEVQMNEISGSIRNGFVGTASPYYSTDENSIPYLMSNNVRKNKLDLNKLVHVDKSFHDKNQKSILSKGDLLTVQSGHIGTTCVVTDEFDGANCHALIVTSLSSSNVIPEYISYFLNSFEGYRRLRGIFVGSTIKHINVKDFKKLYLPIPSSIDEQIQIVKILKSMDFKTDNEKKKVESLLKLKEGLMQQLLTGKVRVPVDEDEVIEA